MTWIEAGNGLFSISTPDETWRDGPGAAGAGLVMKVYVKEPGPSPSRRTDSGAVEPTAHWITRGIDGKCRSVAAVSRRLAGNCLLG